MSKLQIKFLTVTSSTPGLIRAVVLQEDSVRRLPPAPGRRRHRLCRGHWGGGGEGRGRGGRQQGGEAHRGRRRGGASGVRDGPLVAVAPLEGPGAALHLTQAADGVEDDGGAVDGQLGQVQVCRHFSVQVGSNPVLQVGGEHSRLKNKKYKNYNKKGQKKVNDFNFFLLENEENT